MSATRHHPLTNLGRAALCSAPVLALSVLATSAAGQPAVGSWTPTSLSGAPEARWQHVAVWTGSRMIVWGGVGNTDEPNTGGLYDPAADTWAAMSTDGAQSCYDPRAVWTGSKMIVWGAMSYDWLNEGQAYAPGTDSWAPVSTTGAPTARVGHTAVWTGSRMIVWGGTDYADRGVPQTSTGGLYDPATDAWTATSLAGAPSPREGHTAVWTGSKMIVWGGSGSVLAGTGAAYDPATDTWAPLSTTGAPTAREGHTAVWTGTRMIVWGGYDGVPGVPVGTGASYDPATDTWSPLATAGAPTGRSEHTAVWTGSRMIVWGGWPGGRAAEATGGVYDPSTDTWTPTSAVDVPTGREYHTAVWTGSKMVVWGGFDGGGDLLDSGGVYSPPVVAAQRHDFDGDRKADLLWQHQGTGDLYAWLLDGTVTTLGSPLTPGRFADTRWQIRGLADFDRDGRNDLLWHNQVTGELYVWFLGGTNGLVATGGGYLTPSRFADTRWQIQGVADFDGDGMKDLLWRHQADGSLYVWFMNGLTVSGGSFLTPSAFADPQWAMRAVADFDGDGKSDLLWHHQGSGSLYVWFLGGAKGVVTQSGSHLTPSAIADTQWRIVQVADFNADGKNDVLWHHQGSGALYVWFLGGLSGVVTQTGGYLTPAAFTDTSWKVAPR